MLRLRYKVIYYFQTQKKVWTILTYRQKTEVYSNVIYDVCSKTVHHHVWWWLEKHARRRILRPALSWDSTDWLKTRIEAKIHKDRLLKIYELHSFWLNFNKKSSSHYCKPLACYMSTINDGVDFFCNSKRE